MKGNKTIKLSSEELMKLQMKSLGILKYFKDFCKQNGLLFYLCGGGCIGAVRNKGFIPWDDDVDVFMPREDYEKLCSLWEKYADKDKFSCLRTKRDFFTGHIFTTIVDNNTTLITPHQLELDIPRGVAMDVFPLDGCPNSRLKRFLQKFWALIYSLYMAQIKPRNHGKIVNLVSGVLLKLIPGKKMRYKVAKYAEKQMSKHEISDCEKITELCAGPGYMKNEYDKNIFKEAVYKEFEGEKMPLPCGYDEYLKIAFGDYNQLPPPEKRVPHHDIIFMDLEKSYKFYKNNNFLKEEK